MDANGQDITADATYTLTDPISNLENIDDISYVAYSGLAGEYEITVNVANKTVRVKSTDTSGPSPMYIIGGGIGIDDNSWYDPSLATEMTPTGNGNEWEIETDFVDDAGGDYGVYFMFVGQNDGSYAPINYGVSPEGYESDEYGAPWVNGGDDVTYNMVDTDPAITSENIDDIGSWVVYYYLSGRYRITLNTDNQTVRVVKL